MKKIADKVSFLLNRYIFSALWPNRESYANSHQYGTNVTVGRHTYGIKKRTVFSELSPDQPSVSIGNFCSIASGVVILANADHPTNLPSIFPFKSELYPKEKKPGKASLNLDVVSRGSVTIGHDVWLGTNAIVLSGVSIGTGAVIGAGAVVTKDIPAYAIAVGNPARVVRYRFEPEIIVQLLQSEWWLLTDESIQMLEPYFYSDNIQLFLDKIQTLHQED
jgi:acetyltransferase-like isoleucine patch superfamily enzyme